MTKLRQQTDLQPMKTLPSPPKKWITGHAMELLAAAKTGKFSETLVRWSEEYGPMMFLQVFHKPIVMVGKPKLVEYILTHGQSEGIFQRSPVFYGAYQDVFGFHIGNQTGPEWKWRRQAATPSFRANLFTQKLEVIIESCQRVIGQLEQNDGATIQVDPLFINLTMGIIASFFLGVTLDSQPCFEGEPVFDAQRLYQALGILEKHVLLQTSGRSRWFRKLPTAEGREYQQAHEYIQRSLTPRVAMALKVARSEDDAIISSVSQNFKDSMLVHFAKNPSHNLESLMAETKALIFAGHDTTAHTLSFAVGELGLNPQVFQSARALVDQVWDKAGGITVEGLKDLAYIEAIAKETIRLHPVATSIPLVATQDTEIDGIHIPKGAGVEPFLWVAGRDPDMYPHPNEFRPERWLQGEKASPQPILFGFSRGPHYCLGAPLALLEATVMLSLLIRQFDWELVNGRISLEDLNQNLTIFPRDRMPIHVRCRQL